MYLSSTDLPETETKIASLIQKMVKGDRYILCDQILTRASTFPMNVLLTWKKEYDEPLVVATTSRNPDRADKVYGLSMVGLFLDGIRAISRHIRRATMQKFREFILALILPLCRVWNIHPSDVLPI